ncbi:MAG TPA: ABC transporter ATP-binding protein [Pyrinomonadaceae bacterium]|jgi:iron complex transport system ATP-binding protein|nr:ABC transporter ATP-binding protein [Pyrinomonadaceae bacterium]
MLEAKNISVGYGAREVVQGVSFRLESGKVVALCGANGAGKTTLLKALNSTLPLTRGEILLDEKALSKYSRREAARNIAVVAQEAETKFPVTVMEFVLSGRFAHGGAFGWEKEEDFAAAAESLGSCDLENYGTRLMNELSGGERQRAVLARALATHARILLLDEPTANLDLAHQIMMLKLVHERCRSANASAVVITHDLNLASAFADEILLLKNGKVTAQGSAEVIFTVGNLKEVFGVEVLLDANPASGKTRVTANYGV